MEAAIYPPFEDYTPFDFDLRNDERLFPSGPTPALDLQLLTPVIRKDSLPSNAHTQEFSFTFGVNSLYPHLPERLTNLCSDHDHAGYGQPSSSSPDSESLYYSFHFASRRVSCRPPSLDSPVAEILGTNIVPSAHNVPLIKDCISMLTSQCRDLESELYVFRMAHDQMSRKLRSLSGHMDIHRALLLSPQRRLDFLTRIMDVHVVGKQDSSLDISLAYIKFFFSTQTSSDTQRIDTDIEYSIDFSTLESYKLSPLTRDASSILEDPHDEMLSSYEAQATQAMLKEAEELLQQIEHNAGVTRRIIETLESQQNAVQSHLSKHKALIAPINKLYSELLAEIFDHTLDQDELPQLGPSGTPIILSNICSHWRSVALSSSCLWCYVKVPVKAFFTGGLDCLLTWLKRSGSTRTLSLCVELADYSNIARSLSDFSRSQLRRPIPSPTPLHTFISILQRYSPRWERLEFDCVHGTVLDILCGSLYHPESLPNLTSILFCGDHHMRMAYGFPQPWDLPNLRSLHLDFDVHHPRIWVHNFPNSLANLTELKLRARRGLNTSYLLDMLARCPLLEECDLKFRTGFPHHIFQPLTLPPFPPASTTKPLTMKRLHFFFLATDNENAKPFLEELTLPRLREFCYKTTSDDWERREDDVGAEPTLFVDRSPIDNLLSRSGLREVSWDCQPSDGTCKLTTLPAVGLGVGDTDIEMGE
ncbi:hypothetical protein D9758_001348 [Tetrapyrgos nigripes]|uniref:F-box domain-containing protein n=1 Tax=Tetrapyrgos nigripes TaxID=182062 RepID=A0A8H5GSD6_9AGAR|nr:hypothetical protein D9758_001348 [Tetrapyrgos nigripes]